MHNKFRNSLTQPTTYIERITLLKDFNIHDKIRLFVRQGHKATDVVNIDGLPV
jgi:hypothetical protein